jgi:hypothetical protein
VTIGQGIGRYAGPTQDQHFGFLFEVPEWRRSVTVAVKFRMRHVPAAAEILASDRLSEFSGTLIDPNSSKGTFRRRHARRAGQGRADQGRHHLCRHADLSGFPPTSW